jgi:NACHT domain
VTFAVMAGVDRLNDRAVDSERQREHQVILDWLTPDNYAPQQSDILSTRQEGTGQWLLDSEEFQSWYSHPKQTLFSPGIPGAGKTIMTSLVVNYLYKRYESHKDIGIAYLYCNFNRRKEQTPDHLLASILKQLLEGLQPMPDSAKQLYELHNRHRTRPTLEEVSNVLHSISKEFTRMFIIIDALDECQDHDGGRRRFLSEIFNLQSHSGSNIFSTSRYIPDIVKEFERATTLEIRANDKDVEKYLKERMWRLSACVSKNPDLKNTITEGIIEAVDGMYVELYATLVNTLAN